MTRIKGQGNCSLNILPLYSNTNDLYIGIISGRGDALSIEVSAREVRAALDEHFPAESPTPKRPDGAEDIQQLISDAEDVGEGDDNEALANYIAARLTNPTIKEPTP